MYEHERSLVEKLKDLPFALIGVNSDPDLEELRKVVKDKNLTWRSFWNGPKGTAGEIAKQWDVRGWPTVYLIDASGKIRFINPQRSEDPESTINHALESLLEEMGHPVDL